jgi:hypothetical protein
VAPAATVAGVKPLRCPVALLPGQVQGGLLRLATATDVERYLYYPQLPAAEAKVGWQFEG